MQELKTKNKTAKLTMFNAYDHKRFDVSDTLSVLKFFEDDFIYKYYELVHGTQYLYDVLDNIEDYDVLSAKIAISSSYHTTMLMQLSGTPCWLISNNAYYDQKRESLEVKQTFEEFIEKPFLPSFNNRLDARKDFFKLLNNFINEEINDSDLIINIKYKTTQKKTVFQYFTNKILTMDEFLWQKEQTNRFWEESEVLKQDLKWQKEQTNRFWEELKKLK